MADIVERLRKHVNNRGGPSLQNGAWEMMLEAADLIERLRGPLQDLASYEMVAVGFSGALKPSDIKDCLWVAGFAGRQPEFRHFEAARDAVSSIKNGTP
jgi:hypothetical protein